MRADIAARGTWIRLRFNPSAFAFGQRDSNQKFNNPAKQHSDTGRGALFQAWTRLHFHGWTFGFVALSFSARVNNVDASALLSAPTPLAAT